MVHCNQHCFKTTLHKKLLKQKQKLWWLSNMWNECDTSLCLNDPGTLQEGLISQWQDGLTHSFLPSRFLSPLHHMRCRQAGQQETSQGLWLLSWPPVRPAPPCGGQSWSGDNNNFHLPHKKLGCILTIGWPLHMFQSFSRFKALYNMVSSLDVFN